MVAEHGRVVFFDETRPLLVGWHHFVVQGDALVVGAGDGFEATVFRRGIAQVVGHENDLRPRRTAQGIVPLHPVLVPIQGRFVGVFSQEDDATRAGKVAQAHLVEGAAARGGPVEQLLDGRIVLPARADVLALVLKVGRRHPVFHHALGLVAQFL